jgi:phosphate transport system substrate-binding protein
LSAPRPSTRSRPSWPSSFGRSSRFKTPKIESTGSGGGIKLFCGGVGVRHPDIANSSRRITPSEVETCRANGVAEIVEVKIGYDGIVLANAKSAAPYDVSLRDLFLALAKHVPNPTGEAGFVPNPYERWSEIAPALPDAVIEVLGPPPTSGTRDAFLELVMEGGCKTFSSIAALTGDELRSACHPLREDGRYIDAGENDNLIVQKLESNPRALGIFGYSFLEQNSDKVRGARVGGVAPEFETIADGSYSISRPLYFYVKKAHIHLIPGIREYLAEFTSDSAWGDGGYLRIKASCRFRPRSAVSLPPTFARSRTCSSRTPTERRADRGTVDVADCGRGSRDLRLLRRPRACNRHVGRHVRTRVPLVARLSRRLRRALVRAADVGCGRRMARRRADVPAQRHARRTAAGGPHAAGPTRRVDLQRHSESR